MNSSQYDLIIKNGKKKKVLESAARKKCLGFFFQYSSLYFEPNKNLKGQRRS